MFTLPFTVTVGAIQAQRFPHTLFRRAFGYPHLHYLIISRLASLRSPKCNSAHSLLNRNQSIFTCTDPKMKESPCNGIFPPTYDIICG